MSRSLRPALALAAALAGVVVSGGAANADIARHTDAANDVVFYENVVSDEPADGVVDPTRTKGDIVGFAANHRLRYVSTSVTMAEVDRDYNAGTVQRFYTNEKKNFHIYTYLNEDGTVDAWVEGPRGNELNCRVWTSVDEATQQVRTTVTRKCLSYPTWVRAGAGTTALTGTEALDALDENATEEEVEAAFAEIDLFLDDATIDGGVRDDGWLAVGPAIRR